MTHVSKFKMKDRVYKRINDNFIKSFVDSGSSHTRAMLQSLLTKTERMMLAKRLAIIVMLDRDYSYYQIMKTLKVSTSTTKRLHKNLESNRYFFMRKRGNRKGTLGFLDLLEVFLSAGMPSIAGPRGQKRLNELRRRMRNGN